MSTPLLTQKFTLFPNLPTEIRHSILTHALNTPALVPLIFDVLDPMGWDMHLICRTIPPLLHTNRESRLFALTVYPKLFTLPGNRRQAYVHFEVDTVLLTSSIFPYHSEWFFESVAFKGGLDMDRITKMAVNINYWRVYGPRQFLRTLCFYSHLQFVTLFIEAGNEEGEARFVEINDESDCGLFWRFSNEDGEEGVVGDCEKFLKEVRDCYNGIVEDEQDEDHEYVAKWSLPELKAMKLVGTVERQVGREKAEAMRWWIDRGKE